METQQLSSALKVFRGQNIYHSVTYVLAFKALNWVSVKYMSSSFKTSPPGNVSRLAIAGRRSFLIYKISITLYS